MDPPPHDPYIMNILYGQSNMNQTLPNNFDYNFTQPDVPSQSHFARTKGKGKNFSMEEDILLVDSYINISTDAIIGTDQSGETLWKRVHDNYHAHKTFYTDRNETSLEHRFQTIRTDVGKFSGFYAQIEQKNQSGKTEQDKIADAKNMYKAMSKKSNTFKLQHCWDILRKYDKWDTIKLSTKKNRRSESPICSSAGIPESINLGEDSDRAEEFPNYNRPLGKKSSIRKGKSVRDGSCYEFDAAKMDIYRKERELENTQKQERFAQSLALQEMRYAEQKNESAQQRKEFAQQFAQNQELIDLERKKYRTQEVEADDKIMDLDTTIMSADRALYYQLRQKEIIRRRLNADH